MPSNPTNPTSSLRRSPQPLDLLKAIEIRRRYAQGERVGYLAAEYGVGRLAIYDCLWCKTHRPRIVVELSDDDVSSLFRDAARAGQEPEVLAAELLKSALAGPGGAK